MMQIFKVVLTVGVSATLLWGCNSDGIPVTSDAASDYSAELTLTNGLWLLGKDTEMGLPNIYVFSDDGSHRYYDDDANVNAGYVIKNASVLAASAHTSKTQIMSFKLFDSTGLEENVTELNHAQFSINEEGHLTISSHELSEPLSGSNMTSNDSIIAAVSKANEDAGINGYVQILDTNHGGANPDVGELRLKLSDNSTKATVDNISSGKMSVNLVYQVNEETLEPANNNGNNAYVSLYASGTSNVNLYGEVVFNAGNIFYRSTDVDGSGKPQISELPIGTFTPGEELLTEVNWANGYYTFTVNDVVYDNNGNGFEAFDTSEPVQIIALKLGDTSNTTHYELLVDNLTVYSHDNVENEVIFSDSFNTYSNGYNLSGNPYNNNSAEAIVILTSDKIKPDDGVGLIEKGPVTPGNPATSDDFNSYSVNTTIDIAKSVYTVSGTGVSYAEVRSGPENSENKVLYVEDADTTDKPTVSRVFTTGPAESGTVKTSIYIPSTSNSDKSIYLTLSSKANSTSSSARFAEVYLTTKAIFRGADGEKTSIGSFTKDQWADVSLTWARFDDGTYGVTVTVDDAVYDELTLPATAVTPEYFTIYTGDAASTGTYAYFDDLGSELFD